MWDGNLVVVVVVDPVRSRASPTAAPV